MNLAKIRLFPYLLLSISLTLLTPIFSPSARFFFLVPCIVIIFYQKSFVASLWSAFACGAFLDLLSTSSIPGLFVTSYCAAAALLYHQKRHFFADNLSTLPLLTILMSITTTIFQALLAYTFHKNTSLNAGWYITNIMILPLFDGAYAFLFFIAPGLVFGKPRRRGSDFFLRSSTQDER